MSLVHVVVIVQIVVNVCCVRVLLYCRFYSRVGGLLSLFTGVVGSASWPKSCDNLKGGVYLVMSV